MFKQLITNLLRETRRLHARQAAKRHLRDIDDYLLRDIGIDRSQVDLVVDGMMGQAQKTQPCRDSRAQRERSRPAAMPSSNCGVMISSVWSAVQPLGPSRRTG